MILRSLLALIPSLLIGFLIACLCWPGRIRSNFLLKGFIGSGIGLGISSCFFFFWSSIFSPGQTGYVWVELLLLAGLTYMLLRQKGKYQTTSDFQPPLSNKRSTFSYLLLIVLIGMLGLIILNFTAYSLMKQNGDHDAWTIWNLRARFIFRSGRQWINAFSPELNWTFHADYPLLLPLNIVRVWELIGSETQRAPTVLAGIFLFSTIGLLLTGLTYFRSLSQALFSTLILVATPQFITLGSFQIADIPLS